MRKTLPMFIVSLVGLISLNCSGSRTVSETDIDALAQKLTHESPVVDTHIDLPMRLHDRWEDITILSPKVDFDYPRARQGGLSVPFMSVYIPPEEETRGTAPALADTLIALVQKIAATWPDKFAVATSTADVRTNFARGVMSLVMGLENGAPIAGDVRNLRRLHDRGIRYVTLCHGLDNHICDSSYDTTHTWNGLSPFGKTLIPEMNRSGMMIDVSHITDDACAQVLDVSTSPIIASHSSCRSFTPGFARNLPDELIRRIGANGGVVMVNFGSEFLTQAFQQWEAQRLGVIQQFMREHGVSRRDSSVRNFVREWRKDHPVPYASIGDLVDHIDRIVELAGIDHVGFGSDFEGLGDMLPAGLKDVSGYPNVVKELLRRGYSEQDVKKICSENLMRVWEEVEAAAM